MLVPDDAERRRSLDFVSDQLTHAGRFRILTVVDDCTGLMIERGKPRIVVSDNGSELASNAILAEPKGRVAWHYITPGKPMQNAVIENFNGRLRDGLLRSCSRHWPKPAPRLHAGGPITPTHDHTRSSDGDPVRVRHARRDLALRYAEGSAPAPVATTSQPGKSTSRGELRAG